MDRAYIKSQAKEEIPVIRGSFACILLIIFATNFILNIAAGGIGSQAGASLFSLIFNLFVSPLMTIALAFFAIQGWRMKAPRAGDWMNALFDRMGRKIGGSLWMSLKILLWALPFLTVLVLYLSTTGSVRIVTEEAWSAALSGMPAGGGAPYQLLITDNAGRVLPFILYIAMGVTLVRAAYSYYFTNHILASRPNVGARDAVKLSVRMTKGNRFKIFVTELSFLGWALLSVLTFGILYIVYVGPYMALTIAGIFDTLKEEAIREGRLTYADFGEEDPKGNMIEGGEKA